jgi:glucose-6-phosphate isomerase
MKTLSFDPIRADVAITEKEKSAALHANALLHNGQGAGNDFLGWVGLPSALGEEELQAIETEAARLRDLAEVILCIGIGGSYLGARAVYEALSDPFNLLHEHPAKPILLFAGQNLSEDYLARLLAAVENRSIAAIVISKSGTTTEPAIAFRLIRDEIEHRYGRKEAARRIVAVTDRSRGALKTLADREGYRTFVIPDDVGGRYSVLTPVGLLPLAAAGIDIRSLLAGACEMERATADGVPFDENPAARYAAVRNILYQQGFMIEILASYEPQLQYLAEWWKQLFGESEGKQGRGIFPASVTFTADLHSMGQFIQDGSRNLFETVIDFISPAADLTVEEDPENLDGLNFLSGMAMRQINRRAMQGTILAHTRGGVPNLVLEVPAINEEEYGYMVYFFMLACGVSGYLLGVNPFDQPGVEAYKKNMFALLGKPGYEALRQELLEKLGE